jgi:regulator of protease activity HflC (stomatin/prohibitin superfamily)
MALFTTTYEVKPNTMGFLFRNNVFEKSLTPGFHDVSDFRKRTVLYSLPTTSKLIYVPNQEVLSKDNVALRFSFHILYSISEGEKFLTNFSLDKNMLVVLAEAEQRISSVVQIIIRNKISAFDCESLNENRASLTNFETDEMEKEIEGLGVKLAQVQLRDMTFPKSIQDLFSKHLEAKIRSKADLENARTAVATARALKNASELMKDDENIRFFQTLETINKIAEKGRHTFMIGDLKLTK